MSMQKAIVTTSWDDGHPLDLKLAELLGKYNIPGTFYIPPENSERECLTPEGIHELSQYVDIGGHTLRHVCLTGMEPIPYVAITPYLQSFPLSRRQFL